MQEAKANREFKNSVFTMLFSEPDVLRELYSAIEGVNLPEDIPISINTLTDVLFRGKLNDISFTIDDRLVVIIEHQSTINENMPLRMFIYLADIYKKTINRSKFFQKKMEKIPIPELIVLYNGTDAYDDYKELRLSDAFKETKGLKANENYKKCPLELIVKVYNVNNGRNPEMLERSKNLEGYSILIGKIRELNESGLDLEKSIKDAVEYCISKDIIREFLIKYRPEVMNMLLQDLTVEEWRELDREEGREEGLEEGVQKNRDYVLNLFAQGLTGDEVKQRLEQENTGRK